MYAVIRAGGKQYRVAPGDVIKIEKLADAADGANVQFNDVDRKVSDVMQRYWTTFAKTGDPNAEGLPAWPRFDATARAYVEFTDDGPVAKEGLRRQQCDVFMENVKRLSAR